MGCKGNDAARSSVTTMMMMMIMMMMTTIMMMMCGQWLILRITAVIQAFTWVPFLLLLRPPLALLLLFLLFRLLVLVHKSVVECHFCIVVVAVVFLFVSSPSSLSSSLSFLPVSFLSLPFLSLFSSYFFCMLCCDTLLYILLGLSREVRLPN